MGQQITAKEATIQLTTPSASQQTVFTVVSSGLPNPIGQYSFVIGASVAAPATYGGMTHASFYPLGGFDTVSVTPQSGGHSVYRGTMSTSVGPLVAGDHAWAALALADPPLGGTGLTAVIDLGVVVA